MEGAPKGESCRGGGDSARLCCAIKEDFKKAQRGVEVLLRGEEGLQRIFESRGKNPEGSSSGKRRKKLSVAKEFTKNFILVLWESLRGNITTKPRREALS